MSGPEHDEQRKNAKGSEEEGFDDGDTAICDLYLASAKDLVSNLDDPCEKELCTLWMDFIVQNIEQAPVAFDYLKLFLLSLHQEVRVHPFDDLPPNIEEVENIRIDVISMGRKMIEKCREYQREKAVLHAQNTDEKTKNCKEAIPLIEYGSTIDHKDYFATQRIPHFGRQCYYTNSTNDLPFWWPVNHDQKYSRDYLSRIAWFMYMNENKTMSKLDECTHVTKPQISTRLWLKDAAELKKKEAKDSSLGFRWHSLSVLPYSRTKLDRKVINKFYKDLEKRGMEVLNVDESAENVKELSMPNSEKFTIAGNIKSLLNKKMHGTVDPKLTVTEALEDKLKETQYNTDWYTSLSLEDEIPASQKESPDTFLRKITENSLRRLLQTSPECINIEDETKIRLLRDLYNQTRTGEQPPPPSPHDISEHDLLQKGLSWNIPAFKRPYKRLSSMEEDWDNYDESSISMSTAGLLGKILAKHQVQGTAPSPCSGRSPPRTLYTIEEADERSGSLPYATSLPRGSFPRESAFSQRSSFEDQQEEGVCPFGDRYFERENSLGIGRLPSGTFDAGDGGMPQEFPSFGDATGKRPCPGQATEMPKERKDSLCFENAEDVDFMDQFLLPTADIEFDEEAQDNIDFGGGYDEQDDWVAPPEIEQDQPYEMGLPPVAYGRCSRTSEGDDRRAGREFANSTFVEQNLEPINWPETEHLYDIRTDFDPSRPPFEFLDIEQSRNEFPPCQEDEDFSSQRWLDLKLVADQLGYKTF